ncbi:U32 family peptidase [Turneriella parva]|uniref:Peptidase U32 n=1 Tax=Turneriella parva (strain ATCC BAA-1111 / DSM 21527 / NCTC 11395 / H) TaxID=869212 RepID=I4B2T7_TURPD|nr:U32 family peptidase [Turneriella parva]AFM11594.1 peptidase U32 [Turneriella parva DSM 21527]
MKIPELLMPAGSPHKLRVAIEYGADAVYCGVPRYSLRARENEFRLHNLGEAVEFVRARGKKIYFTVNAIPRNSKVPGYLRYLKAMAELKPDGLIMADPGLIMITRDNFPDLPVHISVQANVMNFAAVEFWHRFGAKRVILSREVTLAEVREIRQRCPDMEIEVFVHGSICIAHSGRCFMSNYFKNRDANQGACNNACRDQYQVYLMNPEKEDAQMELISSDEGTFLMNSKDLRAIEFLDELTEIGVDSIKVEGRTKNDYYAAMIARTYRRALDDIRDGKSFDRRLLTELDKVASRKYFSGFLTRGMEDRVPEDERDFQNEEGNTHYQSHHYAGCVKRQDADGIAWFDLKTRLTEGDELEVFFPGQFESKLATAGKILRNGSEHTVLSGGIGEVGMYLPFAVPENAFLARVMTDYLTAAAPK